MPGVALCGGGMKCAAHLGVLQAMDELGVRPSLLAGSSMGAVTAALCAMGADLQETAEQLCRIRMSDVFVGGVPIPGLNHESRLRRLLRDVFGKTRVEHLPTPLLITAYDLVSGSTYWIDHGDLADALYASCALPGLFAPLSLGKRSLADGCLSDPLPVCGLRERGVEKVIGVRFGGGQGPVGRRPLLLAFRAIDILLDSLVRQACADLDLLIEPMVGGRSGLWWNRYLTKRYVEAGRVAVETVQTDLLAIGRDASPSQAAKAERRSNTTFLIPGGVPG